MTARRSHAAQATEWANKADSLARSGKSDEAAQAYARAARHTEAALAATSDSKPRTRAVFMVNGPTLWLKANEFDTAEKLAHVYLSQELKPTVKERLTEILMECWQSQSHDSAERMTDWELHMDGGKIGPGLVPYDEYLRRLPAFHALFWRGLEWDMGCQYRASGLPPKEVRDRAAVYVAVPHSGSYKLRLKIDWNWVQGNLFVDRGQGGSSTGSEFVGKLLATVSTLSSDNMKSHKVAVPEPQYRAAFLHSLKKLAPDGSMVGSVSLSSGAARQRAILTPDSVAEFNKSLNLIPVEEQWEHVEGSLVALEAQKELIKIGISTGNKKAKEYLYTDDEGYGSQLLGLFRRTVRASGVRENGKIMLKAIEAIDEDSASVVTD